jgi:hypothetical protein
MGIINYYATHLTLGINDLCTTPRHQGARSAAAGMVSIAVAQDRSNLNAFISKRRMLHINSLERTL